MQHKWLAKVCLETYKEHPEFIRKGRQRSENGPKMQMDTSQKRRHIKPTFIWEDTQSPQFKKHPLSKIRILSNLSHFNLPLG